jgi:hypothetical protein
VRLAAPTNFSGQFIHPKTFFHAVYNHRWSFLRRAAFLNARGSIGHNPRTKPNLFASIFPGALRFKQNSLTGKRLNAKKSFEFKPNI